MRTRGELSKSSILSIALRLVDEHGVGGVTMRGIADEAGLTPMSLYRHVRTKEEIIEGLRELVWQLLDYDGEGLPWRENLFETFKHVHRTLLDHPGLVDVMLLKPTGTVSAYSWVERLIAALGEAGFSRKSAMLAIVSLESYALGFAIQQRVRLGRDLAAEHSILLELPAERFPNLLADPSLLTEWASDEWFLAGLERQIESLERHRIVSGS